MEEVLCPVDHIKFDIEYALEHQIGAKPLPFPGMDSEFFKLLQEKNTLESSLFLLSFQYV